MLGESGGQLMQDMLEKEEVKAMMYHQWKHPHEVKTTAKPDFKKLFGTILDKTGGEKSEQSETTQFLISEIQELKLYNRNLRRRILVTLTVAASVIFLIAVSGLFIMNQNQVFRKTYTENIAPKGQKSKVVLPDGTRVFLNSGSVLRYDNFFGKKYRTLDLVGEAYFEVTNNEKLPFIIRTEDIEVEVLGTKFNVMAYPEDDYVETIVTEGEVEVTDLHQQASVVLSASQKATYIKLTREFVRVNVNPEIYLSWKENLLTFDNENFANVIKKLERWYDVSIYVEGTDSIEDRFTMTIKSESLREVLELISLTTNINFDIEANEVTIQYK